MLFCIFCILCKTAFSISVSKAVGIKAKTLSVEKSIKLNCCYSGTHSSMSKVWGLMWLSIVSLCRRHLRDGKRNARILTPPHIYRPLEDEEVCQAESGDKEKKGQILRMSRKDEHPLHHFFKCTCTKSMVL